MNTARSDVLVGLDPVSMPVEWRISNGLVAYEAALAAMDARAAAVADRIAPELVWLLEHPPLYTAGTSAKPEELIAPRFPVHTAGRGGQITYHGPGQRVAVFLDVAADPALVEARLGHTVLGGDIQPKVSLIGCVLWWLI